MKRHYRLGAVATAAASLAAAMTPMVLASPGAAAAAPRHGGVLHVVMPWLNIPHNFNPLNPGTNSATAGGTGSMLYEPLMYDNVYTGRYTPVLATSYKWSQANTLLTLKLRPGVKWSDGKPFSAADVAFTFNLLKAHPAMDLNGDWTTQRLSAVKAVGKGTVTLKFAQPNTAVLPFVAGQLVVPKHIFSRVADPATFANTHPVGTGPFVLSSWSGTQVDYKRNPHYWQAGRPYLAGVQITAVKSNDTATLLMLNGNAAYTYTAITDPERTYVRAHPAWNRYWWPVTALNMLYMNTQKAPFDDAVLRRAIAMSIDTRAVAQRAYRGAVPAATGLVQAGVTPSQVGRWLPRSLLSSTWKYDPKAAVALLTSHGYRLSNGQLTDPSGNALPTYRILVGAGWTDFISMASVISQDLQQIGLRTEIDQEPWASYYGSAQSGQFDFLICWTNGNNLTPYYAYHYLLSSEESAAIGKAANTNYSRFSTDQIDKALQDFTATSSLARQKAAIATVAKAVLTSVPAIPLTGRPNFFDYSIRYFTGWPSAANPYNAGEAPDAFNGGAEQLYLNVHVK